MKEQEYIDVSDLCRVRMAIKILVEICPANSAVIPAVIHGDILSRLSIWEEQLATTVDI